MRQSWDSQMIDGVIETRVKKTNLNNFMTQDLNASGRSVWNAALAEAIDKLKEFKVGPYYFLTTELEKLKK